MPLPKEVHSLIRLALSEDVRTGDITTLSTIGSVKRGMANIISKAPGVIAGTEVAAAVFKKVDKNLRVKILIKDGTRVRKGSRVIHVSGRTASILTAERVALNFMQRLSGVATTTAAYMQKVKGRKTKVIDTRKTTPGMRFLEKKAVLAGGGGNHRQGLYDMFLIKDNHIDEAGGIAPVLQKVAAWKKKKGNRARVEIETRNNTEVKEALPFKPDWIMLDNMSPARMKKCVSLIRRESPRTKIEASGNISLSTVRGAAIAGVDFISVGALTHSVISLDLSLLVK